MSLLRKALFVLLTLLGLTLFACSPTPHQAGPRVSEAHLTSNQFITADNVALPLKIWPAQSPQPGAIVVAVHGFNDYSNAFAGLGEHLAQQHNITTYAYDQRGFGATEDRGSWAGMETYLADLRELCQLLRAKHPNTPIYVLGESMGGALAMVAFASDQPPVADGVILSAPAVWARKTMPWYQRAALFVAARLFPWASFTGEGVAVTPSDNRDMLIALGQDPLVIKATKVGAMYGLTNLMDAALASADRFDENALIMIGDKDEIVPNHASALMLETLPKAASEKQKIVVYQDGYHMLPRDLQGQVVMDDIAAWIKNQDTALPSGEDNMNLAMWVAENLLK